MATQNCSVAQGGEPEDCKHGCRDFACCLISLGGENAHHCLSQLLKRLGREPESADSCGGCSTKIKEDDARGGTVEGDRGVPGLPSQ